MMTKTFASPIFIFYWLLMISIILDQPALSARTPARILSSGSGAESRIGVHSNPSSSAPRATRGSSPPNRIGVHPIPSGTFSYGALNRKRICNATIYGNCFWHSYAPPCNFSDRCSRNGAPSPAPPK